MFFPIKGKISSIEKIFPVLFTLLFIVSAVMAQTEESNEKNDTKKPWYLRATVEGVYDTNVISKGDSVILPSDISNEDDWGGGALLTGGYRIHRDAKTNLWVDCRYISQYYSDMSDYDLQYVEPGLRAGFKLSDRFVANLRTSYSHAWVGAENYDEDYGIGADIIFIQTDWANVSLGYKIRRAEYFYNINNSALDRDGITNAVQLVQNAKIPRTQLSISAGYRRSWINSDGSDYDYNNDTVFLSAWHPFILDSKIRATASYGYSDYRNPNSRSDRSEKRKDGRIRVYAAISKEIFKNLTIFGSYRFINNDSNLSTFEYARHTYTAGATYEF